MPIPNANVRHQFRQELAERREHDGEARAGEAEADQHAGREMQHARRRGIGHQREPGRVDHAADRKREQRAVAVRDRAGERQCRAPQQVLDRDREREHVAAPAEFLRCHRLRGEAEHRARPESEDRRSGSRTARMTTGVRQGQGSSWLPSCPPFRHRPWSRRLRQRALDALLADRQIDGGGRDAKRHRQPPHDEIGAGLLVQHAAEPHAEEAADLVTEECEAKQHGHVARAEHQHHQAEVGGTVESHRKPMAVPNAMAASGLAGRRMKAAMASERAEIDG